ncbi:MAG: hypothetical protein JW828_13110 [Sedimentisphaerales bacterium]|nr:hypothetical protein [Sedimentisphaerales bacterium]
MRKRCKRKHKTDILGAVILFVMCALIVPSAIGLTVHVTDPQNNPVSGFRWMLEKDTTHPVTPGVQVADSLSVAIHSSHAPVVAKGDADGSSVEINVPDDTRYMLSILPYTGYVNNGKNIAVGQTEVTVVVNPQPVPTAQISVYAFHDRQPVNGIPDTVEPGLAGFSVVIADIGGQQMLDAFGNMLGTTYQKDPDTGEYLLDGDGNPIVDMPGSMVLLTDVNGELLIKNLAPGKYAVQIIPPSKEWIQTTTIEGTHVIDAWVKANEPPVFVEFGPASYHVFIGFTQQTNTLNALPNAGGPTSDISGRVVYNHFGRPPFVQGFWPGEPVPEAWIGLNSMTDFQGLYVAPCNPDSTFTIPSVPPGTYQLVTWDLNLDAIFGFNTVVVPPGGGPIDLGNVLSFAWFGKLEGSVFLDLDEDGFRDPDEMGIRDQAVNIRFRDGTLYQGTVTDFKGEYEFAEVFPFFKWLVTEVDFARFKATGMTSIVDLGGAIPPDNGWDMPSRDKVNPLPNLDCEGNPLINPNTLNDLSRTEVGEVLTQAMHLFLGQTNIIEWGKTLYGPAENGGISGIVYYAVTRAEDDPRYSAAEGWEPGIPNVQVNLYTDIDANGAIDDLNNDGEVTPADVDNYPFGWADGDPMGPEDQKRNTIEPLDVFHPGDAIQITTTDSWDDSNPCGCTQPPMILHGQEVAGCFDNFATWNQVRPGIFDGGYAFGSYFPGGMASGNLEAEGLPNTMYIVEVTTPSGLELVKEEDKNVDFGDQYIPSPLLLPPVVVGDLREVPPYLSYQTYDDGTPLPGIADLIEAPFAGRMRPLPDRKQLIVSPGKNAAADFFLFSKTPKAARAVGFINNDLAAEFDTTSPVSGEKSAPAWIPVAFFDYAGNEVARVYCDEFGTYNALLPSTATMNIGAPSGVSPNMLTIVLNHPGPIPDPGNSGQMIIDPWFDPDYSQVPYIFNFTPGTTTYLDTPVIPIAAFVGYPNRVLDVEPATGTPVIYSVMGPDGGPIVCEDGGSVIITAVGSKQVPNPDYVPDIPGSSQLIIRDYGFGTEGGTVTVAGEPVTILEWTNTSIEISVDFDSISTGQLVVTRNDTGLSTELGITLHVDACDNVIHVAGGANFPNTPIQDAIDNASEGALIIIEPGTYWENPIVWKDVRLQGSGAASTIINANPVPAEKVALWQQKVEQLVTNGDMPPVGLPFAAMEGAGIMVNTNPETFTEEIPAFIDGLTISGAVSGGGIYLFGNADFFEIRNNLIKSNQGTYGGGISVGLATGGDVSNQNVKIYGNHILKNGGVNGGGGVTIYANSLNYEITDNLIMGNFSRWSGGGIAHNGSSDNGLIARNRIVSNEVFYGAPLGGDGGGIHIQNFIDPEDPGELDAGAGSVAIFNNLIQGNLAGSGDGGGISAQSINGTDAMLSPDQWYKLDIMNNMIINNVAAKSAGGIFLSDALRANIVHNTIANNDSTATSAEAFSPGILQVSNPQPAGVVSTPNNQNLADITGQTFTDPYLHNNIIHGNRSFYWDASLKGGRGGLAPNPTMPVWDLAVVGFPFPTYLSPIGCLLTSLTDATGADYDDGTNLAGDPSFSAPYNNTLAVAAVLDEGGNFVTVRFDPIGIQGNYHIGCDSDAINIGDFSLTTMPVLNFDYDGEIRPGGMFVDAGADELRPSCSADFDVDGDVDLFDFLIFIQNWMTVCGVYDYSPCDLNGDGIVNLLDYQVFASQFNRTNCCP